MIRKLFTLKRFLYGKNYFAISALDIAKILSYIFIHKIETWHITQFASAQAYQKEVIRVINSRSAKYDIVDIGCGIGLLSRKLKFNSYMGFDQSKKVINLANKINNDARVKFDQVSAQEVSKHPIKKNSVILSLNFLHTLQLADIKLFLHNIISNCNQGTLVFDIPNDLYSFQELCPSSNQKRLEIIMRKKDENLGRELIILQF